MASPRPVVARVNEARRAPIGPGLWLVPRRQACRVGRGEPTVTRCLEGRFTQGVNLRVPRSEAVRGARG